MGRLFGQGLKGCRNALFDYPLDNAKQGRDVMRRMGLPIFAVLALPTMAIAQGYSAPATGTKFVYGVYEGGEVPIVTETISVLGSDDTSFVGMVEHHEYGSYMARYTYGATSLHCDGGYNPFLDGIDAIWPFAPGKAADSGAFFVIGKDVDYWLDGKTYDTWAIREFTEHGSTWVTRVSPDLGIHVDDLVSVEKGAVPNVDVSAIKACLAL